MCTNSRFIYNPYSRKKVLVNCGHCPACLQAKAQARTTRIRNNVSSGSIALFITLTYSNDYVPYIKKSELSSSDLDIKVYRNASCRYTYSRSCGLGFKKVNEIEIIDTCFVPFELRSDFEVKKLHSLKGMNSDCVGVCINSDFQKFIKRLKIYINRHYERQINFSYFYCSELGSHTKRPHFHALLFIRKNDEALFRDAIVKAWPFADSNRTQKYVEIARDAASYVSSYVNCSSSLSSALQVSKFKPSHNYSQGFGMALDCFNLDSILDKIDRRDLYYYRKTKFDGDTAVTRVPIPLYVINRYFPKFKGFSWLPSHALECLILNPETITDVWHYIENPLYDFSPNETYKIYVRLSNAVDYFCNKTGLSKFDYLYYYRCSWLLHFSTILRDSYENIENVEDFSDFYSNACELVNGDVHSLSLPDLDYELNPNARRDILVMTNTLIQMYDKYDKEKKVVNYCMSQLGHNV